GYAMGLRGCSFLDLNDIWSIFPISGENNLQRYTQKIRIPKLLIGWGAGIVKEHVEPGGGELSIQLVGSRVRACAQWHNDCRIGRDVLRPYDPAGIPILLDDSSHQARNPETIGAH